MARPASFTDEEDDIILCGFTIEETNLRLRQAGFAERTEGSIKGRRNHLRRRKMLQEDPVLALRHRRAQLIQRRDMLREDLHNVEEELKRVDHEFHASVSDELAITEEGGTPRRNSAVHGERGSF